MADVKARAEEEAAAEAAWLEADAEARAEAEAAAEATRLVAGPRHARKRKQPPRRRD